MTARPVRLPAAAAADEGAQQISYNVRQAHDATGIGETTLRRLVREGRIAARYFGATILIDARSLAAFVASLPSERQVERECAAARGAA